MARRALSTVLFEEGRAAQGHGLAPICALDQLAGALLGLAGGFKRGVKGLVLVLVLFLSVLSVGEASFLDGWMDGWMAGWLAAIGCYEVFMEWACFDLRYLGGRLLSLFGGVDCLC